MENKLLDMIGMFDAGYYLDEEIPYTNTINSAAYKKGLVEAFGTNKFDSYILFIGTFTLNTNGSDYIKDRAALMATNDKLPSTLKQVISITKDNIPTSEKLDQIDKIINTPTFKKLIPQYQKRGNENYILALIDAHYKILEDEHAISESQPIKIYFDGVNYMIVSDSSTITKEDFKEMAIKGPVELFKVTPIPFSNLEKAPKRREPRRRVVIEDSSSDEEPKVPPNIDIIIYSEKSIAVVGEGTKEIKDDLKRLGARFNPSLTIDGGKRAGWIFPISKKEKVEKLIGKKARKNK